MRILGILSVLYLLLLHPAEMKAQQSATGTSFWLGFMSNATDGPDDMLVITISAQTATSGLVEIPGQNWSQNFYIEAQSSVEVLVPDMLAEVDSDQFIEDRAIHVESGEPVSVVALNYAQSSADATRIFPETFLGTNYIAASYQGLAGNGSEILIVAAHDDTEMQITPSVTTSGGNAAGVPFTLQLDRGECYRIDASGTGDLTGTRITATAASGKCRPFAVFGGAGCANIPASCFQACDHLFEQLYDLEKWGTDYIISPFGFDINPDYAGITEPRYTYRIISALNGTTVTIDNVTAMALQSGEFMEYTGETDAHCIHANQPIAVVQYMQGISCGGNGDPAMLVLDPLGNEVQDAVIHVANSSVLNTHYLNLLVPSTALGAIWLDGSIVPAAQFSQSGACAQYWTCTLELDPGEHLVHCPAGFSGTVYGISNLGMITTSYATALTVSIAEHPVVWEQTICSSSDVQLDLPANYTSPQWYYSAGDNTLLSTANSFQIAAPIQNAAYELRALNVLSGCVDTFYYSVESPAEIPVSITQDQPNVCSFESVTLTAVTSEPYATYQYVWSPTAEPLNGNPAQVAVQAEENVDYSVTLTTPSGCSQTTATTTVVITQGDVAGFAVVEDFHQICLGESVDLEVEVEQVIWRDNFDPAISWGDWQTISGGEESNLCGTVTGNGLYFNGNFPREAVTQPLDLSGGGTVYFSLKVADGTAPCDDAEPGDNVVLSYSVGGGAWIAIQTFYESAYPDFVSITVPLPTAACNPNTRLRWRQSGSYIANQDNWVLENAYVGQQATASFECAWSPQSSLSSTLGAQVQASPTQTTLYEVTTVDPTTGCDYIDSVWVEVGQPFTLDLTDDLVICYPQQVMLSAVPSAAGQYNYAWTPNSSMQGAYSFNPLVEVQQTETYVVDVVSEYGCTAQGSVIVTLGSLFELDIEISEDSLCFGESVTLTALLTGQTTGIELQWIGDPTVASSTAEQILLSPLGDVNITCMAIQASSGCEAEQTVFIDVTPPFTVDVTPDLIQTCEATGTTINATASLNEPMQWTWSPPLSVVDAAAAETQLATEESGTLTVTASSAAGCMASASLVLEVSPLITDLGPDTGRCVDETYTLSVTWPPTYNVLWSTGATSSSITVDASGVYSVFVQAPDGCTSSDEVLVEFFDYPELDLGSDTSACEGEEIRLQAGAPGLDYLWNTGQLSREIYVTEPGIYHVEITNGYCVSSDTIELVFHPLPIQPFLPEYEFCFEAAVESFFLDAQNPGSYYVWNNDSISRVLIISEPGNYSVLVNSEHGCSGLFETTVNQECVEALFVPNSFTPDGDGINDEWLVYGANIVNFHLQLYNRWGELFFESFDIEKPWMGQRHDGKQYVDSDAYPYIIRYQTVEEDGALSPIKTIQGFVSLIR